MSPLEVTDPSKPSLHQTVMLRRDETEFYILAACIQDPAFYQSIAHVVCADIAQPGHGLRPYDDFRRREDNILFSIIRQFRSLCPQSPGVPADYVKGELHARAQSNLILPECCGPCFDRFQQLLAYQVASLIPWCKAAVGTWIQLVRTERDIDRSAVDKGTYTPEQLHHRLGRHVAAGHALNPANAAAPFGAGWDADTQAVRRLASGLKKLDDKVGGGFAEGEGTLFIASTGAGKTVMACQLAAEFAMNGHAGIFVTTEQAPLELEMRFASNRCSIPFHLLKDGWQPHRLNSTQRAAAEWLRGELSKRVSFIHWTRTDQTRSLAALLESEIANQSAVNGHKPAWCIVDWLGGALEHLSVRNLALLRQVYQQAADDFFQVAAKHGLVGVAFAQANYVQARNNRKIDASCIAECKSLGRSASNIVGISSVQATADMEIQGEAPFLVKQFAYVSKARKGEAGLVPLYRQFEYQRFAEEPMPFK